MSRTSRAVRATLALAVVAVTATAVLAPAAPAAQGRRVVRRAAPAWAQKAQSLGNATGSVSARVYLEPRGGLAALKQDVLAVSTPGSAAYHHFLTPSQYRAHYEPTAASAQTVRSWLTKAGMTVSSVEPARRYIAVTGSTQAAERAFGTTLKRYRHRGQLVRAPADAVSAPASAADHVMTITGLDSTKYRAKPKTTQPPVFANARPCSRYYGQVKATYQSDFQTPLPQFKGKTPPYAVCGYNPAQFRSAYEGGTDLTGKGVKVGIIDAYASPSIEKDVNTYSQRQGDQGFARGQFSQNFPGSYNSGEECGAAGWYGEETLDVEAVHGMAPDAGIRYYAGASCFESDLDDALDRVVDENAVSMVSNSYGELGEDIPTSFIPAFEQPILQGEMQGIGFMFSSGDDGDEVAETGSKQADWSATDPYVTAVGGTSQAIGRDGQTLWQTGWGTNIFTLSGDGQSWDDNGFLYGAGGGYSSLFNRPQYQTGVVPLGDPGRAVPDVAMDGDPTTGMLVGETQRFPDGQNRYGEYRIGGTSLSSPLFTGMQALAEQSAGHRLGFSNPAIYKQARRGQATFEDVLPVHTGEGNVRADYNNGYDASNGISYSVRTFDQDSSLTVTKGWDDVTGVGVPSPLYLVKQGR
jgi:subtilase family serine protease